VKRAILTFVCLAALAACDKPSDPKPADPAPKQNTPSDTAAAPTGAATGAPAVASTIDDRDLTTPADFEESAEKTIDAKNYKKELASLEEQIAKE
jgi:hypothetical protein